MELDKIQNRYKPIKENYLKAISYDLYGISEYINNKFKNKENFNVLDYGCAYGDFILWINSFNNSFKYLGIDIDKEAEKYCNNLFPEKFEKSNNYDLILCLGVVELSTPEENDQILKEIKNCANQDSTIVLGTDLYSYFDYKTIIYSIISFGKIKKYYLKNKHYKNFMTHGELETILQSYGFEIVKIYSQTSFFKTSSFFLNLFDIVFKNKYFRSQVFYHLKIK